MKRFPSLNGRVAFPRLFFLPLLASSSGAAERYDLSFSTYIGGSAEDQIRDVAVDDQGNVYVTGGTKSSDFPRTSGAPFQGVMDVFVAKLDPSGKLTWSTLIGGPEYDRAYAIEVDKQGCVYVAGRAGRSFPVTLGAFQTGFLGYSGGSPYYYQNAFVTKLKPDGSMDWSSYVGVSSLCRDLAIDANGDIYVPLGHPGQPGAPTLPSEWFTDAYQKTPAGGLECGVVKISADGSGVVWATWIGGSGDDSLEGSIRVDSQKQVHLAMHTFSTDLPRSPGARAYGGQADYYVAKFDPSGSELLFGTYLGGSGNEWLSTHNLAVDDQGNAYVATCTSSADFPIVSTSAFQEEFGGGNTDWVVAKLSPTGVLIESTFIGGNGSENPDGVYGDAFGHIFVTGETSSTNFPVTIDTAYQTVNRGNRDAFLVRLSGDFKTLLYSTYMGGAGDDTGRTGFLGHDGNLYVAGMGYGSGWPTMNAYQQSFGGGASDGLLAAFKRVPPPAVTSVGIEADGAISLVWAAFASVYTVEQAVALQGNAWEEVKPTDQWPIPTISWTGGSVTGRGLIFFRVRGE